MPHTVNPIPAITLPSFAPGTTVNFSISVTGAVQPETSFSGSVSVEFNGETVNTPIEGTFTDTLVPSASAVVNDPRIEVSFSSPLRPVGTTNAWTIPGTITVV